ncbi:hypothetical protein HanRHA438_Chr00c38g0856641 [Helianthus annuus]|nr:hypothetical protein HanRHA438_Chr00c38g0856641 [Helianthus annuus]
MGVISRRVIPVCSILCVCCPSLRARSRHPVKRYKKLLADIFPRSQGGEPNERKIGKLCEYASKNPLRIPKITDYLEQKFYKNLRNENVSAVKAVLLVYGKLLSSYRQCIPVQLRRPHSKALSTAEEVGDDERVLRLRSAGLEVLASMVRLLGEQPHVSMDFENGCTQEPFLLGRVCLHNMVQSATGVTNVRRVLEPILHKFGTDKLWLPEKGLPFLFEVSLEGYGGTRSHLLLPILVKHLDNKHVTKQPVLQLQILNVATQLSGYVKHHASVTIVGAISDLIKHLRKCLQRLSQPSSSTDSSIYIDLQSSLENCISNLSCKVGDVGPILDTMAIALENIPTSANMARANISAIYRTAQVIKSTPNITYFRKVFPDALFHHLLLAMSHPDHEARVLAHRVFLYRADPVFKSTWSIEDIIPSSQGGFPSMILQKAADGSNKSILETIDEETIEKEHDNIENHVKHTTESLSCGSNDTSTCNGNTASSSMRLSGHQASLVLSSIWYQVTSMQNSPENFEAMAHTYTLALSSICQR